MPVEGNLHSKTTIDVELSILNSSPDKKLQCPDLAKASAELPPNAVPRRFGSESRQACRQVTGIHGTELRHA